MYPTYSFTDVNRFSLHSDDIKGIQSLYGPNTGGTRIIPDPQPPTAPDACDPKLILDAVTTMSGETLYFKDRYVWRSSQFKDGAQLIESFLPSILNNIDAAYESPNKVFIFKGQYVWALSGFQVERGYPKSLTALGLPRSVRKITAAVYDQASQRALLFAENNYYSFDENSRRMDSRYPKRVEAGFPGMTGDVTAAHYDRGYIYLYSGTNVFEFYRRRLYRVLQSTSLLPCRANFPK